MDKIKIGNEEFELVPMGIDITDRSINLTISTDKNSLEVETAFTDASRIEHLLGNETLAVYTDGAALKSVRNNMDGTYTVIISTDKVSKLERDVAELSARLDAMTNRS